MSDFEAHLFGMGFTLAGSTELHRIYDRGDVAVVVRVGATDGALTENEMLDACDAAGVEPPKLQPYFGAP